MKHLMLMLVAVLCSLHLQAQELAGHWRGVLKFAPEFSIVLALELTPDEQGYQLKLMSPNQHLSSMAPSSFTITGNSLKFTDDKLNATFSGTFNGDTLTGTFTQRGDIPITLTRLSAEAVSRLQHEQQWFGDLQLSKSASLPLVLNVAVIADGYHVTLDSPKQQSFGIPVNEFSVSDSHLSFASALISASYKANWQQEQWQGTFVQGMAMPLVLKKKP